MKRFTAELTPSQRRAFFLGVLMLFMFVGVVCGTLFFIRDSEKTYITSELINQRLLKTSAVESVLKIFVDSLLPMLLILLIQLLCGFFAVGQPFCVMTLFFRGIAGGIAAADVYSQYGFKGFFIILVMLVPILIFDMYILSLGARESLRLSGVILGFVSGKNADGVCEIRLYMIKFLVLAGFALIASVLDSAITYFFADFLLKP